MPLLAKELNRLGLRTTVINPDWDAEKDKRGLPGLDALQTADVGIFFVRFLKLEGDQFKHFMNFVESGKPLVCLRTSTHAFNYPEGHKRRPLNLDFGREAFGTPYLIHLAGRTQIAPVRGSASHPILTGVDAESWESPGTLYLTRLEPGVTRLVDGTGSPRGGKEQVKTNAFGTHELKPVMTDCVAWTWTNKWKGRVFGTSLGHPGDFADRKSIRVIINGIFWAAGQTPPSAVTEVLPFNVAASRPQPKKRPQSK